MRSKFPGYYKPTKEEFDELWNNGIFVLDTNVLLDLFRYSEDTVESLIKTIIDLGDRIWIPYQVSLEYHRNLNDVISSQINTYKKTIDTLEEFKKQLEAKRSHPFLQKDLHAEINQFCEKYDSELIKKRDEVEKLIIDNPVKEKIGVLLDDKLGDKFDDQTFEKICLDGAKRYLLKQPPGYQDAKTKQGNDIYGDLIIWKEIIEKSKSTDRNIILVTGDVKDDWFLKHSGKTIGPRPELIQEFQTETGKLFYAYATNQFLEFSNKYFDSKIKEDVIDEVKNVLDQEQKKVMYKIATESSGEISQENNSGSTNQNIEHVISKNSSGTT